MLDLALALTAVVAISYHFAHHGHRATSATRATSQSIGSAVPPSTRQLAQWLRADLPMSTRVVTDAGTAALLQRSGRRNVTTDLGACRAPDVIFLTAALANSARQHPLLAHCISAAHTLASLGSARLVEIDANPTAAARDRRADLANRKTGGTALAANRAITMPATIRAAVRSGRLDLRAETVLAELCARTPLRLMTIRIVPAEARARRPARTVEIGLPKPGDVAPILDRITPAYRPSHVVPTGPHQVLLTWRFLPDSPPVLK